TTGLIHEAVRLEGALNASFHYFELRSVRHRKFLVILHCQAEHWILDHPCPVQKDEHCNCLHLKAHNHVTSKAEG
ncbi:hypothetical protein SK128_025868, partial [Halocaridina rubra]